ncbi:MAG: YceI family protein [Flavobacterium sp.]|uniref:YceI family protein n=1 Tax=Flavobacterium sp. TaxID=239 RepID=UPI00326454CC
MKKIFSTFVLILISHFAIAQDKIITKAGQITFEASVPSFEEVKATNKLSACVLNTKTGEIASVAMIKSFKFKSSLMQEHFNENYIESDKYPKAIFKGKIENFDILKLTTQKQEFTIKGTIELHGKSKNISVVAKISKNENITNIVSTFTLNTDDFNIDLPFLISSKVSKKVEINLDYKLL